MSQARESQPAKIQETQVPEGGYGWVVVVAYAVETIFVFAVAGTFTLVFKDRFTQIGLSATEVSLIININAGIGIGVGFFIGPLLNKFGYRKMAFVGGAFLSLGLILTSWANSLAYFLITYSFMTAIGTEICLASFALALNTYFKVKRTKAFGVGLTLAGIGFAIFPQMERLFLELYGVTGCGLLIGGISLNIIVAAALLQPVKYHVKKKINSREKSESLLSVAKAVTDLTNEYCRHEAEKKEEDSKKLQPTSKINALFDLDLLKDPRFVILIFGFSLVIFAETNFSILTPLMLAELNYTNAQIANFISLLSLLDIASRFLASHVERLLKLSVQAMCSLSLVATIVGRVFFTYAENYRQLLMVGIGLGVAKGFRYVFLHLVVPAYLPLERLAAGSGIQTVIKGLVTLLLGPLLGVIKDYTGSYLNCIILINVALGITVIMWAADLIFAAYKKQKISNHV